MSHLLSITRNGIYSLIDHFAISSDMESSEVCKRYYACDDCIVNDVYLVCLFVCLIAKKKITAKIT